MLSAHERFPINGFPALFDRGETREWGMRNVEEKLKDWFKGYNVRDYSCEILFTDV